MPEIALPGLASMVPVVRHAVRALLAHCPRLDDAELIASEMATNAVAHSRSGLDGAEFRLVLEHRPGWARLEVHDDGPLPRRADPDRDGESGRGWELVDALADKWGHDGTATGSCTWAELEWETESG